ncbi:hypothetical protein P7C70_g8339, partial [Phenoliferia sp. Uapishka_3]
SSRRSSTSSSHPGQTTGSPALLPQTIHRHLRSPSPAPLPAIKVPPSPKISPADKVESLRLYGDANSTPFFRRLCWSTDGSLLLTPAGLFEDPYGSIAKFAEEKEGREKKKSAGSSATTGSSKKTAAAAASVGTTLGSDTTPKPTVYIYSRSNVSRPPIAHLPGHKTTSIAIRFCPVLWQLRNTRSSPSSTYEDQESKDDEGPLLKLGTETVEMKLPGAGEEVKGGEKPQSLFDLPYRMVYAVATLDCVFLYDTQQAGPICIFGNLHYAPFTDLSWTSDGQTLVVSSQDGYCSIIAFDPLELGTPYSEPGTIPSPPTPTHTSQASSTLATLTPSLPVPSAAKASLAPAPAPEASTGTLIPDKRVGETEGDGAPVKKKKKATLTFHGPIGAAPSI